MDTAAGTSFHLRFRSLFGHGRGFAFPCDEQGRVDLERLSGPAMRNYLRARALVGRELGLPTVESAVPCPPWQPPR